MTAFTDPSPERSPDLEKAQLDIGFVPLTDCAPLVIALEKGFFDAEGLDVTLWRERAWASIRDKTGYGLFDAAQMLYPMPLAMSLGVGGPVEPTVTALCLDLNGNAITVSPQLARAMRRASDADPSDPPRTEAKTSTSPSLSPHGLKRAIRARAERGEPLLTFGVVFPTSTHHYELRYWMAAGGIDPDCEVNIIVLPPPEMPEALRDGRLDGYCVGEPWNAMAVRHGWGEVAITKYDLWNNSPEKVLGVTRRWAEANPGTHRALVRAVLQACAWCDEPTHRAEVARIISAERYVNAPVELVGMSMQGTFQDAHDQPPRALPDFNVFHRYAANYPWRSHAMWFLLQMRRWGQLKIDPDIPAAAEAVLMPEVYRDAAEQLGLPCPLIADKSEGRHAEPWILEQATRPIEMGPDRFMDGVAFDPDQLPAEMLRPHRG